jgi:hypothetical protein
MNEDRACAEAFGQTGTFEYISAGNEELQKQELFDSWVDTFAKLSGLQNGTVAIVDYMQSATPYEFEEFKEHFISNGYDCVIADITTLNYDGSKLHVGDVLVDAVYRRAVTHEVVANISDAGTMALINAVSEGNVIMIGGFASQVAHSKETFRVLHLPETSAFLSKEEQDFIAKHVPATMDLEEVPKEKDKWIIKPVDGYGSHNVYAGKSSTQDQWEAIINDILQSKVPYVIQEYAKQYPMSNSVPEPFALQPYNVMLGLYAYGGKFAGVYVRAGQDPLIVGRCGGLTFGALIESQDTGASDRRSGIV